VLFFQDQWLAIPISFLQVKLAELGDVLRAELKATAAHLKAKQSVIITNRLVNEKSLSSALPENSRPQKRNDVVFPGGRTGYPSRAHRLRKAGFCCANQPQRQTGSGARLACLR
jgi:hypothetical protein